VFRFEAYKQCKRKVSISRMLTGTFRSPKSTGTKVHGGALGVGKRASGLTKTLQQKVKADPKPGCDRKQLDFRKRRRKWGDKGKGKDRNKTRSVWEGISGQSLVISKTTEAERSPQGKDQETSAPEAAKKDIRQNSKRPGVELKGCRRKTPNRGRRKRDGCPGGNHPSENAGGKLLDRPGRVQRGGKPSGMYPTSRPGWGPVNKSRGSGTRNRENSGTRGATATVVFPVPSGKPQR